MLKASALYIVVVIALVIGILCSALIATAYFNQARYLAQFRYDRLQNNIASGIHILLATRDSSYRESRTLGLFGQGTDSLSLQKYPWGVFDIGVVRTFRQRDTLQRVFSIANIIDSTSWSALYLIDEDRPLSLSGKTTLRGDAYLPKAGVRTAYVDNQSYTGNEKLVQGRVRNSERHLPVLAQQRLNILSQLFRNLSASAKGTPTSPVTNRSFRQPVWISQPNPTETSLQHIRLAGHIICYADTTLIIDSSASLQNVIIIARAIRVKSGFHGNCQLYARDSISVEKDCHFSYPSCLGVFRDTSIAMGLPEKLSLGENSSCQGLIFTYEKEKGRLPPVIILGKNTRISGQVYSQGTLSLSAGADIRGSVMTSRFLYQNSFTAYENYLINVSFDARALSPYYLAPNLTPAAGKTQHVLQWLE